MYLDSSAGYPMDCYIRLRFRGGFSHVDLERALALALRQHPLMYARSEQTGKNRYAWRIPEASGVVSGPEVSTIHGVRVFWEKGVCRGDFPRSMNAPLNLAEEPPLRLAVVEESDQAGEVVRTDITFKLHHAAADAIGSIRFLMDFLVDYAKRAGVVCDDWKHLSPLSPEGLKTRGWCGRGVLEWLRLLGIAGIRLRRCLVFVFRRILPLAKRPEVETTRQVDARYPAILFHLWGAEETASMLRTCRGQDFTMNDVLLQAGFLALRDWRKEHPDDAFDGLEAPFRIAVPTNLRNARAGLFPAANMVSMVFLDRKIAEIDDSRLFLERIHREMNDVKRLELGFLLVQGIAVVKRMLGSLDAILGFSECWTSLVISNIGPVFSPRKFPFPRTDKGELCIHDTVLEEVESASPIRPLTSVALCVSTYAGRTGITLHYDSRTISAALAQDFMDRVLSYVRVLLASPGK
ncbi:MAG: hypothetical protein Q4D98_11340 [Planctomycetia bacterium]|nr:hypothetical protein [Planctomycetia bacterium]